MYINDLFRAPKEESERYSHGIQCGEYELGLVLVLVLLVLVASGVSLLSAHSLLHLSPAS